MLRTNFSLKCMTATPVWIYIYSLLFSVHLINCKTKNTTLSELFQNQLVLLWAQLTKLYPPLPTSVQPISITKTLLIVPTKNERDPPLFTGKLLIKFHNILRNTTQVIIRHPISCHIKFNNSGTAKVKIVKNERDHPVVNCRDEWQCMYY
jgi:hypothetical protein